MYTPSFVSPMLIYFQLKTSDFCKLLITYNSCKTDLHLTNWNKYVYRCKLIHTCLEVSKHALHRQNLLYIAFGLLYPGCTITVLLLTVDCCLSIQDKQIRQPSSEASPITAPTARPIIAAVLKMYNHVRFMTTSLLTLVGCMEVESNY